MQWVLALHIIFMVCWFAAIFYLPRLFVYHAVSEDTISIERFKIMERKLYNGIMTPSAIATILFGAWLFYANWHYYLSAGWMHAKLTLVILLIIYHLYCGHLLKQFKRDQNRHSHKFYRILNEVPVLLLFGIVILVIVKPF